MQQAESTDGWFVLFFFCLGMKPGLELSQEQVGFFGGGGGWWCVVKMLRYIYTATSRESVLVVVQR